MSVKSEKLLKEAEQVAAGTKVNSFGRLMLALAREILKEMREMREFVNSPDIDDLNRGG